MLIYFTILYSRRRLGIVTDEMLSVPKWRFAIIGFLEAVGVATGPLAWLQQVDSFLKSSDGNFLHLLQDYVWSDWILCFSHASWTSYSDFESGVLLV